MFFLVIVMVETAAPALMTSQVTLVMEQGTLMLAKDNAPLLSTIAFVQIRNCTVHFLFFFFFTPKTSSRSRSLFVQ
jgi:hypothetical protein